MARRSRRGVKNLERVQNNVIPSQCPKCGSTERDPYRGNVRQRMVADGVIDGMRYNRITWKRTRCKGCGQHRMDRIYEQV